MPFQPANLLRLAVMASLTAAVGCQDPQQATSLAFQVGALATAAESPPPPAMPGSPPASEPPAPMGAVRVDLEAADLDAGPQRRVLAAANVQVEVIVTVGARVFKKGYPGHWLTRERHAFAFDGLPVGEGRMEVVVYVGLTPYKVYASPLAIRTGPALAVDLFVSQALLSGKAFSPGMILAVPRGAALMPAPASSQPEGRPSASPLVTTSARPTPTIALGVS